MKEEGGVIESGARLVEVTTQEERQGFFFYPGTSLGNSPLFILSSWLVEHVVDLNKLLVGSGKAACD